MEMKRKLLIIGGLLLAWSCAVSADIIISDYKVDGFTSNNLEAGANFSLTISYRNNTGANQSVVGAKFYADYLSAIVENISFDDQLAGTLTNKTNPDFTPATGQIRYQRDAGSGTGKTINNGETIACLSIKGHIKQNTTPADALNLFSWISDDVKLVVSGGADVTGAIPAFPAANIKSGAAPTFAGLNSVTDPQTGNTLNLVWTTNGNAATDLGNGAATYHSGHDGTHSGAGLRFNLYRDGAEISANPLNSSTYSNSGLNDNQTYSFIVRAQDDCVPNHNEEQNNNALSGTPHDYTPPAPPSNLSVNAGNNSATLSWTNPADADFVGVVIVRKPDGSEPNPTLTSASGNENGASYDVGTDLSDGSKVLYRGNGTTLTDSNLTNGVTYRYKFYSFDQVGGAPVQQGNNYSVPAAIDTAPGVAPANVSELRALADPFTGAITLKWKNPATGYGGSKITYTTDYSKWGALANTSPGLETASEESITLQNLATTEVYYFKVFAFNTSPDPAARKFAAGNITAATPMKGGLGVIEVEKSIIKETTSRTTPEVTLALQKKSERFGINFVTLPFEEVSDAGGKSIATLADLIEKINAAAGKKPKETAVATIGFWDREAQQTIGFVFNSDGSVKARKGTAKDPKDIALAPFVGYQIYVKESIPEFKLIGK